LHSLGSGTFHARFHASQRANLFQPFFRNACYALSTMLPRKYCLAIWAVGLLLTIPASPQTSQPVTTSPHVIFVCEHGAAKSVIATAHFNKVAEERGLPYRAIARGTNPDPSYAPKVVAGLKAEGLTAGHGKPELVKDKEISGASRVVTLGCKLPKKAAVTDWADVPSPSENYTAASKHIRKRVEALLDELSTKPGVTKP
jgi:arsenate reductase (thioredoxin)